MKNAKINNFSNFFVHYKSFKTTSVWKWEYVNKIMFSALKSKLSSTPSPTANDKSTDHGNHGINSMNAALQRKFARGVHYNLKLLLRGDRNTGKSCLFKRLQVKWFWQEFSKKTQMSKKAKKKLVKVCLYSS